jgi:RNA polymerase sigma-70 factor, ECF subfamily
MDLRFINKQMYSDFDREVMQHFNLLKAYALKMTNDIEESEDLLQETLLKAFKFFSSFKKGSNSKAWLFRIMINSFINDYRKKIKQPLKVDYDDEQNFYENIKSEDVKFRHFQQDAFNNILDDEVIKALSTLPDDFRTIVFLSDVEGYSYEEISNFVDCPIGTVRSRLHRTRKILYALLYKYAVQNGYARSQIKSNIQNSVEIKCN